ncbi:MAG: N-acetyltransferase [Desulfobacteraceae bacterium]|nr:MAG: N-acetyltransferase [Desulfobacteraceae bacterium]
MENIGLKNNQSLGISIYFLHTQRLGFRPWTEADLDLARGLWGDPEVTRHIGGPFPEEKIRERLSYEIAGQAAHGVQYWPVFLRPDGSHVGCCGLRPYPSSPELFEIGIHLKRAYWGQGFAVEATRAVITYAFDELKAAGLFAGHHPANVRSRQVLAKLGFQYTHDELYPPTGLKHPSYRLSSKIPADPICRI